LFVSDPPQNCGGETGQNTNCEDGSAFCVYYATMCGMDNIQDMCPRTCNSCP